MFELRELKLPLLDPKEYFSWFTDTENTKYNSWGDSFISLKDMLDWIDDLDCRQDIKAFAIVERKDGKIINHIGNCSIQQIDQKNRSGELAIILSPKYVGQNHATMAFSRLIWIGLYGLNLNRLYVSCPAEHKAMRRVCVKLGMRLEGYFREAMYKRGRYLDVVQYSYTQKMQREYDEQKTKS